MRRKTQIQRWVAFSKHRIRSTLPLAHLVESYTLPEHGRRQGEDAC